MCTTCGTLAGWRIFWLRGETRREQRGALQSWGFSNPREGDTHKHTQLLPNSSFFFFLPWAFSTNTTLESCWKLCPSRSILSPPEAGHVSRLCLSTSGSSWADLWAVGGRKERKRERESELGLIVQLILTHSPCRPEHPDWVWTNT